MNNSEFIVNKRKRLGLTVKEFADAIGLPKDGSKMLKSWEQGQSEVSEEYLELIMKFPEDTPFKNGDIEDARFKFIDLFAGIGGIRIPFGELGGHCLFSSEWDKFARKTYRINFGEEPDERDIATVPLNEIPSHDILLGGFPCQPFSQAGLKLGFEDTRGTLFFNVAQIISDKRPAAFLLENVKQLRGHDKGRTLQVILNTLRNDLNYTVHVKVLAAKEFGVPQNRERIFIVGFDNERGGEIAPFEFPVPTNELTRVGDILECNPNPKYTISDKLYAGHLKRKEMHKEKGNGFGFSLFDENSSYTNTISARYYKDGSEILINQGATKNPRKLTPRECARLQGYPEKYIIPVSDSQAYKQFGNSVTVPVIRAIAQEMMYALEYMGIYNEKKETIEV
ncbi:DNA (cytosine-5)-methyltransferase 1 [Bacillus sp. RC218]|uniref:DNA (cytosine-5-)-methyltransferase n=1 Tax=Bacillus sp. RC218 TaxID=3156282 RepID=UPI003838F4B8